MGGEEQNRSLLLVVCNNRTKENLFNITKTPFYGEWCREKGNQCPIERCVMMGLN